MNINSFKALLHRSIITALAACVAMAMVEMQTLASEDDPYGSGAVCKTKMNPDNANEAAGCKNLWEDCKMMGDKDGKCQQIQNNICDCRVVVN